MYQKGEGVPQSNKMAYFWYNLSATLDDDRERRKQTAEWRDAFGQKMTREEIAEAQRLSSEWYEKFKARQDGN